MKRQINPYLAAILLWVFYIFVSSLDYEAAKTSEPEYKYSRETLSSARDEAMRQDDTDAARKLQAVLARIER